MLASLLLLSVLLSFTGAFPASASNSAAESRLANSNFGVMLYYDDTYEENFSNATSQVASEFAYAAQAFERKWDIIMDAATPQNLLISEINACTRSNTQYCSDSICGSPCSNHINGTTHHRNIGRVLRRTSSVYSMNGRHFMFILVGVPGCFVTDETGVHNNALGLAYLNGHGAVGSSLTYYTADTTASVVRIRIIQHEMSHWFGVNDRDQVTDPCTGPCIMSGGFDTNTSLNAYNLWCSKCASDFDPDTHY